MSSISYTTLIEALEAKSSTQKSVTYIEGTDQENTVTYDQLRQRALGLLGVFQDKGLSSGDELIIFTTNNEQFVDAFWACLYGGIIPVPIAVGISDEHRAKLFRIFEKLDRPHLYTDQENLIRLHRFAEKTLVDAQFSKINNATIVADQIGDISKAGQVADITPESRAFIQFSSGSTSEPKGVILTHRNLMTTIIAIGQRAKYTQDDISLSWMPLTHDLGLIGFHLSMVVYNMNQYLIPTDLFSRRPMIWLKMAGEHRASVMTSPNFGFKHFLKTYTAEKFGDTDLSSIRVILNGAEPISVDLCHQFLDTMAAHGMPRSAVYTVYGLAEACLGVALPVPGKEFEYVNVDRHSINVGDEVRFVDEAQKDAVRFAIEGPVVIDCELKITDFENNSLPEQHVGEIQIRGANVTSGYYKNDAENAEVFTGDRWLNTGDVGFLLDGQLIVTGRTKDIIFINGQNYYPHDLENIALGCPQLELGKVVACGITQDVAVDSALLIFILYRGDVKDFIAVANQVKSLIGEQMGLEVTHVIPVKRIPKTTSGKVQRHLLANDYLEGMFNVALDEISQLGLTDHHESTGNLTKPLSELEAQFQAISNQVVTDKKLDIHDKLFEVGISSLTLSEIHQRIDDLYPGVVDITDMFDYQTLAELAKFVQDRQLA